MSPGRAAYITWAWVILRVVAHLPYLPFFLLRTFGGEGRERERERERRRRWRAEGRDSTRLGSFSGGGTSGGGTRWWGTSCATPHRGSASPSSPSGSTSSARPPTTASPAPPATTTTRSPAGIRDSKVKPPPVPAPLSTRGNEFVWSGLDWTIHF